MDTSRTDRPVMVSTEKDLESLLNKNTFTSEEIYAIKDFCTDEMLVSDNMKDKMMNSASFVIALIKNSSTLSVQECKIVFGLYHATQNTAVKKAIENELVLQNTKLASKLASKAKTYCQIEYEDLLQEALMHLFEAIYKYDVSYDTKFSTFAFKHIHMSLNRYIENTQSLMKVPNDRQRKYRAFLAFKKKYMMLHPEASENAIAIAAKEELGFTQRDIESFDTIRTYASPEYIDTEIMDNNAQIKDYIRDENAEVRFDEALDEYFCEEFMGFLKKVLSEKQYKVVVEYYGLDGNAPKSFREIDEERDNLKGRPGAAAAVKHQKAIMTLKEKHKGQLKKFADGIGMTTD